MGLKIAVISPWNVHCGIFTYSEKLINALAEQDVDVYVVRLSRFGKKTPELLQNLVQTIPVDKIDLVHVQHEYGLFQQLEQEFYPYLKALGKPVVTTAHAVGVRREIDAYIASMSDRVIVHNDFCAKMFSYPEKTVIIPHGASSCETVEVGKAKKSWGIDPRIPIVGYCGFISEYKGLETLIQAVANIPRVALLIAGGYHTETDTPYIMGLKQTTLDVLPSRCHWTGYVPDERLPAAYGAMDILCYPSRFATESGALIMALSHGKAVIASGIAPFREKEKLGALMTFKNVADLTRKIKRLLKNQQLREKLEEGARNYVRSVEWSKIAEKHVALYEEVLNARKQ